MKKTWIDLNGDIGESDALRRVGDDAALIPLLSSANIACGAHAGDEEGMRRCIALCLEHGVVIGAHPSYPDREGFGRRRMQLDESLLQDCIQTQLGVLARHAQSAGTRLAHVKPHGALYNVAAVEAALARTVAGAVYGFDASLVLVGLAGSCLLQAGREVGLRVRAEGFADRRYAADGTLVARSDSRALIEDADEAVAQALRMLEGEVLSVVGSRLPIAVDTICLHGDGPHAATFAVELRARLQAAGISIRAAD
jgi:UPF0271 protein